MRQAPKVGLPAGLVTLEIPRGRRVCGVMQTMRMEALLRGTPMTLQIHMN